MLHVDDAKRDWLALRMQCEVDDGSERVKGVQHLPTRLEHARIFFVGAPDHAIRFVAHWTAAAPLDVGSVRFEAFVRSQVRLHVRR